MTWSFERIHQERQGRWRERVIPGCVAHSLSNNSRGSNTYIVSVCMNPNRLKLTLVCSYSVKILKELHKISILNVLKIKIHVNVLIFPLMSKVIIMYTVGLRLECKWV